MYSFAEMAFDPKISVQRIGRGGNPVAVIDNFFPDAHLLRDEAALLPFVPAANLYPGIRAPLPNYYWSADQMQLLHTVICQEFDLSGMINLIDASFSIVTTSRHDLKIGQCLPHPDAFRSNQIALIHYLSPDITAGTAFYRHRSTGLEMIGENHRQFYFEQIDRELRFHGPPPLDYIHGDTHMFDQIAEVNGKFNRALLYLGQQLHSGAIYTDTPLAADPLAGRLTVTAFMTVE